jgi:hypothetical protein
MPDSYPRGIRRLLLATLLLGLVGVGAELLLLGHFEDVPQYVPLVLIGVTLLLLLSHGLVRSHWTVRVLQGAMVAFVLSGILGTWLHYQGNAQFELEITPDMLFWPLFKAAMAGATPVLAPGAMIQLGLIGLAWSWRHPALRRYSSASHLPPVQ